MGSFIRQVFGPSSSGATLNFDRNPFAPIFRLTHPTSTIIPSTDRPGTMIGALAYLRSSRISALQCSSAVASPRMSFSSSVRATAAAAWSDPLDDSKDLNKYICILPDFDDAECLKRRLEVRQQHLDGALAGKRLGRIRTCPDKPGREFI